MADISLVLNELEDYVRGGGGVNYTLTREEATSLFHHTNLIDEKEAKIKKLREEIESHENEISTLQEELEVKNDRIEELEEDLNKIAEENDDLLEEIKDFHIAFEEIYQKLHTHQFPLSVIEVLKKNINTLHKAEDFLRQAYNRVHDDHTLEEVRIQKE